MNLREVLQYEYTHACNVLGDIHEHLPTLKSLADTCQSVAEFGVRWGTSTRAFLASSAQKFRFYDLYEDQNIKWLIDVCKQNHMDVDYIIADDLTVALDPVDLLFIDTSHTYKQLSAELRMHHKSVIKYIVMHDTEHNGTVDEFGHSPALTGALLQFLSTHHEWRLKAHYTNNNGLTVIERIAPTAA